MGKMDTESWKAAAAAAAIEHIAPKLESNSIVGVGTGSTVNHFIDGLADVATRFAAAVASSVATANRLRGRGVPVAELGVVVPDVYVDGADEADLACRLIKGGGGALTREKIIAAAALEFVCIVDENKISPRIGWFPVAVEVIPMAIGFVARRLQALGGMVKPRADFQTDNGNKILDVRGFDFSDPGALESRINDIPGVVCCGIFAQTPADLLLIAGQDGVRTVHRTGGSMAAEKDAE